MKQSERERAQRELQEEQERLAKLKAAAEKEQAEIDRLIEQEKL